MVGEVSHRIVNIVNNVGSDYLAPQTNFGLLKYRSCVAHCWWSSCS